MDYDLCFSSSSSSEAGSYKLIQLPPELCSLAESSIQSGFPVHFTVKGKKGDDAVLCTPNATYSMRSVLLSNSFLVVTPPDPSSLDFDEEKIMIRDQVTQIIELAPTVPRLHTLASLLKGSEYDETSAEEEDDSETANRKKVFYDDIRRVVQASDTELNRGLSDRHILVINGELRPIAPFYLRSILEMILNCLISHSLPHDRASVERLSSALVDDHEVPRLVSTQVMAWFGSINNGFWTMDVNGIVRQVGLSILRPHSNKPIPINELLNTWKAAVGEAFEASVSVDLLAGNYLNETDVTVSYFPSASLPADPARRFSDLFLVRTRWKANDIAPFLLDLAVDSKERDKLILKYARAITDPQGVWYTARAQYAG